MIRSQTIPPVQCRLTLPSVLNVWYVLFFFFYALSLCDRLNFCFLKACRCHEELQVHAPVSSQALPLEPSSAGMSVLYESNFREEATAAANFRAVTGIKLLVHGYAVKEFPRVFPWRRHSTTDFRQREELICETLDRHRAQRSFVYNSAWSFKNCFLLEVRFFPFSVRKRSRLPFLPPPAACQANRDCA